MPAAGRSAVARWGRVLLSLLALVVGLGTGLASTAVHDHNWAWFLLAVAAPAAALAAWPTGWPRIGFTTGWLVLVLVAIQGTAAGSYAISADLRGYLFLASGLGLMVAAIVTLPAPRARGAVSPGPSPGSQEQ
ncbi:hypothetical protein [Nocardioides daejeonensis]|uniref:hypothetical protein n=1 Tax=Nocardioides daejeonensis TaxID=1046556 RepID=UPI000D74E505|nr:hypothetical protein [Nocardioides daejeonensis]